MSFYQKHYVRHAPDGITWVDDEKLATHIRFTMYKGSAFYEREFPVTTQGMWDAGNYEDELRWAFEAGERQRSNDIRDSFRKLGLVY